MENKVFLFESCVEDQNKAIKVEPDEPYPLGIAYLDAILKKNGYNVITKDYANWDENLFLKNVGKIVKGFNPSVIGISMMTMTRVSSYKAIRLIKKINPGVKIILGGMHPSMMYKQLLENFPIDVVCIGESEETFLEVIKTLRRERGLSKIKGIAYKNKNKVKFTGQRPLLQDLDKIHFPSHEVFMNQKRKKAFMLASRGCPNKCSFCCLHIMSKRKYRFRSYKNVVDEIEYIVKKFPQIKKIEFVDDTMLLNNKWVIDMCKEVLRRKIKMKFLCSGRIKPVSKELFYWMQKAGFIEIRFGIETGSEKLLKSIKKGITKKDIIKTFNILKNFKKIRVVKFLMVGFPGEDDRTITETIELTKKIQKIVPMDFFSATPLWVYPCTEVYELMKSDGVIDDDFWLSDKPCPLFTVEHNEKKLKEMANRISIETSMDMGKIFFIKLLIKKFVENPFYYFRRLKETNIKRFLRMNLLRKITN